METMISKAMQEKLIETHFGVKDLSRVDTNELKGTIRVFKQVGISVGDTIVWNLIEEELTRRRV
jgi:ornithine cyclodeaminase/alanine dehydrogenase-like protein (mu-crystallin family)